MAEVEVQVGKRIGNGRAAEVFEFGEGRVIKVWREPGREASRARELAAQQAVSAAGVAAPQVLGEHQVDGRCGLIMERIDGVDGLTAAMRSPWKIWSIASSFGRLHRQLGEVPAPPSLPTFEDRTRAIVTHPQFPEQYRARLLSLLEKAPTGSALCHMDFHPGNVMQTAKGPVVIDFANCQIGHPLADHLQSLLLLEVGVPAEVGWWERVLLITGRRLMRWGYTRGYGEVDAAAVRALRPLIIAQRMGDQGPNELPGLRRMLPKAIEQAERA